jgi:phospholipid/cholesterol/gamma-HCH transport system permease protein
MGADSVTGIEVLRGPSGGTVVRLTGTLDLRSAAAVRRELIGKLEGGVSEPLLVEAAGLDSADVSGMVVLWEVENGLVVPGVRATLSGLRPELKAILAAFPAPDEVAAAVVEEPVPSGIHSLGGRAVAAAGEIRAAVELTGALAAAFAAGLRRPRAMRWPEVLRLVERGGVDAFPLVSGVGLLVGLIIAFEAAQPLKVLGAEVFVADAIGIIVIRELGPLITAIVVAGRSGPALAAELGMMKVNEELSALETMGLDPVRFLVVQRVVAGTVLTPVLTLYAIALGLVGGSIVMGMLGYPFAVTWAHLQGAVHPSDLLVGAVKGVVFGTLVAGLACLRGLKAGDGPAAVGDAATSAVVSGIVAVFAADALLAVLTYVLQV